jgi:MoxR-like ATPase
MQEYAVTVAGKRYSLDKPFFVLATQNPIEQEGTYPLPEAQLDRFMFNIQLDYPSYQDEVAIVKATTSSTKVQVNPVITAAQIIAFQQLVRSVPVADNVVDYAVRLVHATRPKTGMAHKLANDYLEWGAGPRASQNLILASKCNALIKGKFAPDIEDVQEVALPILRHRIVRNFKAEAEGITVEKIITGIL